MAVDLHPDVAALAPLLGSWAGRGEGKYPTIPTFEYFEEVVFSHVGKPFLAYTQRTRATADGKPLHAEAGYLRVPRPGHVELVLAHPSGVTEIEVGTYAVIGDVIELELSTSAGGDVGLTPTAKEVSALGRSVRLDGDELSYTLRMGAVGQPLQDHLCAVLRRKP
jgi:THAP4-like, heme-binding beta-barrel domain